jgi:hypothetical protein
MAENLKPIPLSPEILEKCGFEKRSYKYGDYAWVKKNHKGRLFRLRVLNGSLHSTGNDRFMYWADKGGSIPIVKDLHQLQNLFFALTGEELEVNLTV